MALHRKNIGKEAEARVTVRSVEQISEQAVIVVVASGMENFEARRYRQDTGKTGPDGF